MDFDTSGWASTFEVWGPRILAAAAILIAAFFIGRAAKWGLARLIDRIPGVGGPADAKDRRHTFGARLGEVAYWLVLLAGVVGALNVLQLGEVTAPVNAMLTDILTYVPNIVGAALIFFVGFVVATLVKRLVTTALEAAGLERWFAKIGLSNVAGPNIANALGVVAFALVIIPVAIAALQTLQIEAISGPAVAVLNEVLAAIPNVLAAGIILAIGFFIGRWVAGLVERVLPATGFDRALSSVGGLSSFKRSNGDGASMAGSTPPLTDPTGQPIVSDVQAMPASGGGLTPSKLVGGLVMFAIVAFSAIEAARVLEFAAMAAIITEILGLAGRVIVGGVIITAAVLIADLLANTIDRSTQGRDRFASTLVRWTTIALGTAMGLRFMGIADEIVILAFGLILGSAAVAAALAFGLGGREAAGRIAGTWADQVQRRQSQGQQPGADYGGGRIEPERPSYVHRPEDRPPTT